MWGQEWSLFTIYAFLGCPKLPKNGKCFSLCRSRGESITARRVLQRLMDEDLIVDA